MLFFTVLGVLTFLFALGWLGRIVYETFFYRCDLAQFQPPTRGGWALVTGATAGIGRGFAAELAARGWNLLLVSRSEEKLAALKAELADQFPKLRIETVVSDAASADLAPQVEAVRRAAAERVPSGCLRLLVNNVGVSTAEPQSFVSHSAAEVQHMLTVNCGYTTLLTLALLPLLRAATGGRLAAGASAAAAAQRQRAAILNLSSQSGVFHVPYLSVYSATKAFNLALSHAMRTELEEEGIAVTALTPSFVVSNMTKLPRATFAAPSAETCARKGLDILGLRHHCGYAVHEIGLRIALLLPSEFRSRLELKAVRGMVAQLQEKKNKLATKATDATKEK